MIGYLLALLPLYIFVYLPVSQLLGFPPSSSWSSSPSSPGGHDHEYSFNESFVAFEEPGLVCPEHTYATHILSREPLVLYLEGWLSEGEIQHLLETRFVPALPLPPSSPRPIS
jgi:prolyl 4-hydroxylase